MVGVMLSLLTMFTPTAQANPAWRVPGSVPAFQVSLGSAMRPGFNGAVVAGVGIPVRRFRRFDIEADARLFGAALHLLQPNLNRTLTAASFSADVLWAAGEFFRLGPSLSTSVRAYGQEWIAVAWSVVPQVGAVVRVPVLRAPVWRVALQARTHLDLLPTRLSLGPTSEQQALADAHVELVFGFGRERPRRGRR